MAGYLDSLVGGPGNAGGAAQATWQNGQFMPYNLSLPGANIGFANGTATGGLSGQLGQLNTAAGNQAMGNLTNGSLNYNPNTGFLPGQYQSIYGGFQNNVNSQFQNLQNAAQPQIDRYLQSNQDNEFSKGTLASTAGSYQTAGADEAVNQETNQNYATAFNNASTLANNQFGAAAQTAGQGEQQAEFGPQLATSQTNGFLNSQLQNNQLLAQLTGVGGNLGGLQSSANIAASQNNFQASQNQDQNTSGFLNNLLFGGGSSGGAGGVLGQLIGSLFGTSGGSTSGGSNSNLGGLLGGLKSLFGGGSSTGTTQTNDPGGFQGLFDSMPSNSGPTVTDQEGGTTTNFEDGSAGFSSAGGQATAPSSTGITGSQVASGLGDLQSGLGVLNGLEAGGTGGYGSAAAAGASLLGQTGVLGGTASNAIGAAGNALSGNVVGAAKNVLGAYGSATSLAGETTAQAAAESAAAQSGTASAGAASGGLAGAASSILPVYLASQLYSGLTSGSVNPILGDQDALSQDFQAATNSWLGDKGPGLQGITGDGSAKYPLTVELKDGTQITGDQYQTLQSMMQKMVLSNNKTGSFSNDKGQLDLTAAQNKQLSDYVSSVATKQPASNAGYYSPTPSTANPYADLTNEEYNEMRQYYGGLGGR